MAAVLMPFIASASVPFLAAADVGEAATSTWQDVIVYVAILVGSLALFCILCKILKLLFSLLIISLVVTAAVAYCVHAGYLNRDTVDRINPFNNARVRESVRQAGDWVGDQAMEAVRDAMLNGAARPRRGCDGER